MKINHRMALCAIVLLGYSCSSKDKEETISLENQYGPLFLQDSLMNSLKQKVIERHDTMAYWKLRYIYMFSGHYEEILFFAYSIAYNTGLPVAYFDLYASIPPDKTGRLDVLSEYYLLVAKEKGFKNAISLAKEKYKDSVAIPSAEEYLKQHNFFEGIK